MSRSPLPTIKSEFFDRAGVVAYLHAKGLKHMTERSVIRATYEGRKLLKCTRIGARVYWHRSDVDAWIEALRRSA
ncbi:hypothetical protein B5M45_04670 [Mycobacterium simiae]|uniref:Helix-turn-helix domain-containing protein n=1 Tax=Mycobacterium simiae TaxID=1784 RepID=A0A1X0YF44_MYCSI|nr:hypothetical protein B5M45_04670 [Mycobacterium simiae]